MATDAGVQRRIVFDIAFRADAVWCAVSDGLYQYDGYHWKRFGPANGLPSAFVRTVSSTRGGALWVGTDKGAGVFDGTTFDPCTIGNQLAGPNVRRIVETSDGALWFCCDRWPDATLPGGLTRWHNHQAQHYGVAEGLPTDHVLNLFEQSNGRLLAFTSGGPAQLQDNRWTPIPDQDYPPRDHTWAIHEHSDGRLFAQGFTGTWTQAGGSWKPCPGGDSPNAAPICITADGSVIKALRGREGTAWFARWDGQAFTRASAEVPEQGTDIQVVRQAPDGAIWAVGRGTILRWEYLPGRWSWYPDLPSPILEDRQQRLWFGDRNGLALLNGATITPFPTLRTPLFEDPSGTLWGSTTSGIARIATHLPETIPPDLSGLSILQGGLAEPDGTLWFYGQTPDAHFALARLDPKGWRRFGPAELRGGRILSAIPAPSNAAPSNGIWAVLTVLPSGYEIVHAHAEGIQIGGLASEKPRTHFPMIAANHTHLYLYGYNGLWEAPLQTPIRFQPAANPAESVFSRGACHGEIAAFLAQEGPDGRATVLLRRPDGWLRHPVAYGEQLWLGPDGSLLVADGSEFVLWETRRWNNATYLSLPTETTITSLLRSRSGDYWLGTPKGTLCLRPAPDPPDTSLIGPNSLTQGPPLPAQAAGIPRFQPRSQARRYSFSWRLNDQPWSGYGDWPAAGVPLHRLPAGPHVLEAKARDGLGNEDPSPARLAFTLLPIPIQDRAWFRPALAGLGLGFASLSLALFTAIRRWQRHAGHLEEQVLARTAELRRDLARREEVERALRESESRLRANLENTPNVAIQWYDQNGRIIYWNHASELLYGFNTDEVIGQSLANTILDEDEAEHFLRILDGIRQTGQPYGPYETQARRRDGSRCWIVATTFAIPLQAGQTGFACMDVDITHRKLAEREQERLQSALLQAQKMESIGRLAGGVAHDFNNMLQAILGNTALALEDLPPQSPLRETLEEVQKSAHRSAALTRQLLAFARKQTIRPQVLDLNDTVSGMLKMLRRLIGEDIQLVWAPGPNLWPVRLDPSQVDQILANLCVNARDAIQGPGQVTIATRNVSLDPPLAPHLPEASAGDYVRLTIADTGQGMDAETQSHLFEPFFTTKAPGKGTGLGLATVFGIVKQNQGLIDVTSAPGQGTTVTIHWPRTSPLPPPTAPTPPSPPRGRSETLLLVEDEAQVLSLGCRLLQQLGYSVLSAPTPTEALRLAHLHQGPIHLLITDVIMPGMNGKQLRDQLRAHYPDLPCLFMSGYTSDAIADQGVLDSDVHFLHKPFSLETLAAKIREILPPPPSPQDQAKP